MANIHFLVNPASKSGQGVLVWKEVEAYLKKENVNYSVSFSEYPGHIEVLAREISAKHYDDSEPLSLIVLGGDGTLNESLQGVYDLSRVNIGYIPTGSSNDFARAMNYPSSVTEITHHILNVTMPRLLDLGKLEYISMSDEHSRLHKGKVAQSRYFDVSCGIGFDAAVCEEALNTSSKNFLNKIGLGKLTYASISMKYLLNGDTPNARVILDNDEEIKLPNLRFIVGMNTCFEGGGYKFAPQATPDDGILDICAINDISNAEIIATLPKGSTGNHVKNKKVHIYKAKTYEVIMERPMWVHTDGEVYTKSSHIRVSIVPGKLRFLY